VHKLVSAVQFEGTVSHVVSPGEVSELLCPVSFPSPSVKSSTGLSDYNQAVLVMWVHPSEIISD
jgi:hypothetical protein